MNVSLPKEWKEIQLGEIADFRNGVSFPASARGGQVKLIGVGDFSRPMPLDISELETLGEAAGVSADDLLQDGDLLFVRSNGNRELIGRCLSVSLDPEDVVTHSGFTIRARLLKSAEYRSLISEFFQLGLARRQFVVLGGGTNISNLNQKILHEISIRLPPKRERIALEKLIAQFHQTESKLLDYLSIRRRRKVGLMRDLLNGRRRFPEFQGDDWFEGHIGDVLTAATRPAEWDEDKVYRLASVRRWGGGIFEREHLRGAKIKVKSLFHLEEDDILLSHIQAAYGAIARVPKDFEDAYVSSTYTILVPRDGRIDPVFAEYLFNCRWMWHQAYLASNGFFAERLRLCFNETDFLKRPISIPRNVGEQRKIADALRTADSEIKLLEDLRKAIERQKRGLMQRLLTGEMTLPESLIEKLNAEAEKEATSSRTTSCHE